MVKQKLLTFFSSNYIAIIFLISLFFLTTNLLYRSENQPIRDDEIEFLERGRFLDWYLDGDFSRGEWQSYDSYDVPKLGEFFYGIVVRYISNSRVVDYLHSIEFYETGKLSTGDWRFDAIRDNYNSIKDLPLEIITRVDPILKARKFSIFFFAIPLLILIFLVGKKIQGNWFGLFSMLIIGSNVLFIEVMSSALGDSLLWFFIFLFFYISIFYQQRVNQKTDQNFYLILLGLTFGLATSVKLNGVLLFLYWLLLLFSLQKKGILSIKQILKSVFLISFIGYLIFVMINPFVWKNPLGNSLKMITHRRDTFREQQNSQKFSGASLDNLSERATHVYKRTLSLKGEFTNFKLVVDGDRHLLSLDLLFMIALLVIVVRNLLINNSRTIFTSYSFLFFLSICFPTLLFIPLDWNRYYMPFIFTWGYAMAYLLKKLKLDRIKSLVNY